MRLLKQLGVSAVVVFLLIPAASAAAVSVGVDTDNQDKSFVVFFEDLKCTDVVKMTLRNGDARHQVERSACDYTRSSGQGPRWRSEMRFGKEIDGSLDFEPYARLELSLLNQRTATRRFTYSIAVNGQRVQSGRVTFKIDYFASSRVYNGSDRFVNYCINELRTIYSSRGRLYCVDPERTYFDAKIRKDA